MALVLNMDSEAIEFTCPCCSSTLGLDDAGDLYAITDAREGKAGVRGIRTFTEAGANNDWQQKLYLATEPKQYQPPVERIAGVAGRNNQPTIPDDKLMAASENDWKNKNINPTELTNEQD